MADQETTASESTREPEAEPESTAAAPTPPPAPEAPPQAYEADPRYALPASPRPDPPQARMPLLAALCSLFPGLGNI